MYNRSASNIRGGMDKLVASSGQFGAGLAKPIPVQGQVGISCES